jgi:predicted lipoprotein with Yx(FWY)xxD motif
MTRFLRPARSRNAKIAVATIAATAGVAAAALVGVALAKTFTLQVARNAKVTNQSGATKSENIAVNSRGFAVYTLTGDSTSHPECTKASGCFSFWPPLKVSSAKKLSKAPGIKGRLGVWHRNGFFQVTLAGHPLYRYAADTQRHKATGEGVQSFGGTWHVEKP